MIPTVIDDDLDAARARNRKTLQGYVALPNYRNYWSEAGYDAEMSAVAAALAAKDTDAVLAAMSERWLDDCTLSGSVGRVRDGVDCVVRRRRHADPRPVVDLRWAGQGVHRTVRRVRLTPAVGTSATYSSNVSWSRRIRSTPSPTIRSSTSRSTSASLLM